MNDISNFNEIEHGVLRAWNRLVTATNLVGDVGQEVATEYLSQFPQEDQLAIGVLASAIRNTSFEEVSKQVAMAVRANTPDYEEEIE